MSETCTLREDMQNFQVLQYNFCDRLLKGFVTRRYFLSRALIDSFTIIDHIYCCCRVRYALPRTIDDVRHPATVAELAQRQPLKYQKRLVSSRLQNSYSLSACGTYLYGMDKEARIVSIDLTNGKKRKFVWSRRDSHVLETEPLAIFVSGPEHLLTVHQVRRVLPPYFR